MVAATRRARQLRRSSTFRGFFGVFLLPVPSGPADPAGSGGSAAEALVVGAPGGAVADTGGGAVALGAGSSAVTEGVAAGEGPPEGLRSASHAAMPPPIPRSEAAMTTTI